MYAKKDALMHGFRKIDITVCTSHMTEERVGILLKPCHAATNIINCCLENLGRIHVHFMSTCVGKIKTFKLFCLFWAWVFGSWTEKHIPPVNNGPVNIFQTSRMKGIMKIGHMCLHVAAWATGHSTSSWGILTSEILHQVDIDVSKGTTRFVWSCLVHCF